MGMRPISMLDAAVEFFADELGKKNLVGDFQREIDQILQNLDVEAKDFQDPKETREFLVARFRDEITGEKVWKIFEKVIEDIFSEIREPLRQRKVGFIRKIRDSDMEF